VVGEEGLQLVGQVGVAGQQLTPVGRAPRADGLQVLRQHRINALVEGKRIGRVVCHDAPLR
jgi:hypothetical protein